eukprot:Polyplicarium_translucidae@DN2106_c0_g1_i2.p1
MAILVRNKKCMSVPFDTATFLRVFPRGMCCSSVQQSLGSYTSARTVGRRAIFGFDAHVDRLVGSAVSMIEADSDTNKARVDIADVKERLTEDLAAALEYSKFEGELFITSLVSWTTPDFSTPASGIDLYSLVRPIPNHPESVLVDAMFAFRSAVAVKDSRWASLREVYSSKKSEDSNEVLLMSDEGMLTEGLSSNFFATLKGRDCVMTPPDVAVLQGTVRQAVIDACAALGVEVTYQLPCIHNAESEWDGCFITSTSRLVRPVCRVVVWGATAPQRQLNFDVSSVTARVSNKLEEILLERSTLVSSF